MCDECRSLPFFEIFSSRLKWLRHADVSRISVDVAQKCLHHIRLFDRVALFSRDLHVTKQRIELVDRQGFGGGRE
jgi:hypothetical protein